MLYCQISERENDIMLNFPIFPFYGSSYVWPLCQVPTKCVSLPNFRYTKLCPILQGWQKNVFSHCLKITQNVAVEFWYIPILSGTTVQKVAYEMSKNWTLELQEIATKISNVIHICYSYSRSSIYYWVFTSTSWVV